MPEPKSPIHPFFERQPVAPTEPAPLDIAIEFDEVPPEPATGFLAGAAPATALEQSAELPPRPNETLVGLYQAFQRALDLPTEAVRTIYHPACGTDISPSAAFPDSHVIYVDQMPGAVQSLTKHGYDAHCTDANEFTLATPADVLIVMNADHAFSPAKPLQQVHEGGYVLCNEYNGDAFKINQQPGVRCVGSLVERTTQGRKEYILEKNTAELQAYFTRKQARHDQVFSRTSETLAAANMLQQDTLSGVIVFQIDRAQQA